MAAPTGIVIARVTIFILLTSVSAQTHACIADWLQQQEFAVQGVASDPDGNVLYVEQLQHESNNSGGWLTVEYTDPNGGPLADKKVKYDCRATTPSFVLKDRTNGNEEGVRWMEDSIESYQGDEVTRLSIPDGPSIVDAGFDNAIKKSWDILMAGKKVAFNYLFARDNKFLKLRFVKSKPPAALKGEASENIVFFRIAANNLVFRLLSSPIYVGYDRSSKDLKYYLGPSNLPMMRDQKKVLIRYRDIG